MAQGDTPITVVGNLVADPELRFIPSGAAVANFRIASTPRQFNRDTNQWEDGEALFLTCNCWRQMAENVAESLTKGMRVIVNGRLKQRSYQTREGENRTVFEVEVDEVGPSLKYATANVQRTPREGNSGYGRPQQQQQQQQPQNMGGFGQAPQQPAQQQQQAQQSQPQNDPWNSAPPAGGFGGMDDEPPF
ncbi:single-stranded DNA-binding protein [Corynebacterium sp. NML98-0116]|uniref:Single-stranded DNA-binding protein n=2 Tax=Corynebacterium TaxID=1716 RepID=A0ABD4TSL4_9CORY|nr:MULTISPECIES: single-stranded DNA-binding protein [Corynebacterium]AOX04856.1 single-stranded DNA-binding protein [Corynebacterium sp. NML98-0116]MCO6394574.1 single-stranded DNA-binding protein [Corynebacterium lipophilum]MCQ4608748.1 single-stranded DNA-binding protein [Corynebacterium pseudogenitalium]MCQ4609888.1 single-stranded DNA-binding protein [Corynebacterium sp. CCUG 61414]MCQ4613042.1 single-stranded DNA-binding protein [Corynebacterium sp. CCUG 51687]